jgi:hypothetical protein
MSIVSLVIALYIAVKSDASVGQKELQKIEKTAAKVVKISTSNKS